jgi:hypothetical protein
MGVKKRGMIVRLFIWGRNWASDGPYEHCTNLRVI